MRSICARGAPHSLTSEGFSCGLLFADKLQADEFASRLASGSASLPWMPEVMLHESGLPSGLFVRRVCDSFPSLTARAQRKCCDCWP